MEFSFSPKAQDKISADCAIYFCFSKKQNDKAVLDLPKTVSDFDKQVKGQIAKQAALSQFNGEKDAVLILFPQEAMLPTRIVLLGLGEQKEVSQNDIRLTTAAFAKKMRTHIDSASFTLHQAAEVSLSHADYLHALVEGIELGSYTFHKYKKQEDKERDFTSVIISGAESNALQKTIDKAGAFAQATVLARDLVNEQPYIATPTHLANLAQDIAKSSPQISCKIYDKKQAEAMGMGAFLGIARAADTPPKFIHLEYTPKKKSSEKLAIVGKGITFDSGGINVKPGDHMQDMKMDMAGAAAVLGIFSVIAKVQPEISVMGLIAATPNMISGTSCVPGDVVKALNGKTIEILNTDAEGRVTMADSLSYAVKQGATKIIDFATLTGACMVALGEDITGLFGNNPELVSAIKTAAEAEGENVWEMPLEKGYKKLNKSKVADIANIPANRYGGAITAALFLEEFVANTPWAHMDIAGPAFSNKGNSLSAAGGTGFGVRLMLKLLSP